MHFEVLSTKYANINHFRLFFWKFCYKISLFWAFFLEFFGLGNNLALKAPHYTRTTTLILCITFHFWVRMSFFWKCRGFCRDPLPCSGFILYLHFAGGKSSAGPLLYKPYSWTTTRESSMTSSERFGWKLTVPYQQRGDRVPMEKTLKYESDVLWNEGDKQLSR